MDGIYRILTMIKKSKGFTLIELIVAISILGIITAIAVPRLNVYRSLADKRACESEDSRKVVFCISTGE